MNASDGFKYDVAISFLSADLEVAQQLAALLRDRMDVFLFTERQGDVVGADGVEQMTAVFGASAEFQPGETPEELAGLLTDFEQDFLSRGVKTLRAAYRASNDPPGRRLNCVGVRVALSVLPKR